jgi:hypothetical protein
MVKTSRHHSLLSAHQWHRYLNTAAILCCAVSKQQPSQLNALRHSPGAYHINTLLAPAELVTVHPCTGGHHHGYNTLTATVITVANDAAAARPA